MNQIRFIVLIRCYIDRTRKQVGLDKTIKFLCYFCHYVNFRGYMLLNITNQILAAAQIQSNRCGHTTEAKQNSDNREGPTPAFGQGLRAGF